LFLVLRQLRVDRVIAGATAVLALLFPFSDATWLWSNQSQISLSVVLWLGGLLFALHGLRLQRAVWHGVAVVLYVASILLNEITLVVILVSGVLYYGRASRRRALWSWGADIGEGALAVLLFTSRLVQVWGGSDVHEARGGSGAIDHARLIADQGLTVAARTVEPFGSPQRALVGTGVAVLVSVGLLVAERTSHPELRSDLSQWLLVAGAGVAVAVGGWVVLAPSDAYYSPPQAGIGNRINVLAGLGLALLTVALIRLGVSLALRSWPSAGVESSDRDDARGRSVRRRLPQPGGWGSCCRGARSPAGGRRAERPPGLDESYAARLNDHCTCFSLQVAPGVPVFAASWDLDGAVKLLWRDPSLTGWPAPAHGVSCTRKGVLVPVVAPNRPPGRYRRTFVVDLPSSHATRVDSPSACRAVTRRG
jgi:hypothetical protein